TRSRWRSAARRSSSSRWSASSASERGGPDAVSASDTSDTSNTSATSDAAATLPVPVWVAGLEARAPDVVACWRVFTWDLAGLRLLRRELRHRVAPGAVPRILAQQEAIGDAL